MFGAALLALGLALIPQPQSVVQTPRCSFPLRKSLPVYPWELQSESGAYEIINERWKALGIPLPHAAPLEHYGAGQVFRSPLFRTYSSIRQGRPVYALRGESYALTVTPAGIEILAEPGPGFFNALMTLAQLPQRDGTHWALPCVHIEDQPELRWRIVSDDISRGPFPTMRYFKERIRTLASFKINGYSPYMEQVFRDDKHPYVATPNALTAAQLHELAVYAQRFHVALIPEQQTFAHMHESLKYESLAPLAELPHGYLLAPSDPATYAYLDPVLLAEHAAVGYTPFFHVGADEPLDLGRGRTARTAAAFADHVGHVARTVSTSGTRPMIWDDAVQADPSIFPLLPKQTVIVTFHYGAEKSFAGYIARVQRAGFDQMVSPGANNWNEIYDDLDTAYANTAQFLADAKAASPANGAGRVLGMFMTVWHDDGESLYEATWSPLAFAAASAWQHAPVDRTTWHRTFARAFFGSDDERYASDLDALAALRTSLRLPPETDPPHYLFWSDPFDERIALRARTLDTAHMRRTAEGVLAHLDAAQPPLHPNAARVMRLAALQYDTLGRRIEIGAEARAYYTDARAHLGTDGIVYRSLNVAKYLCWELRDELTAIAPLYAAAWRYESTEPGLDRVLVRYTSGATAAMRYADRINEATREDYLRSKTLPAFDDLMVPLR